MTGILKIWERFLSIKNYTRVVKIITTTKRIDFECQITEWFLVQMRSSALGGFV